MPLAGSEDAAAEHSSVFESDFLTSREFTEISGWRG